MATVLLEKMHKMNRVGAYAGGEGFEETRPKHGMSITFSAPLRASPLFRCYEKTWSPCTYVLMHVCVFVCIVCICSCACVLMYVCMFMDVFMYVWIVFCIYELQVFCVWCVICGCLCMSLCFYACAYLYMCVSMYACVWGMYYGCIYLLILSTKL